MKKVKVFSDTNIRHDENNNTMHGKDIVLSMITKNSYTHCGEVLLKALNSTLQVPYRHFILIDDSTDDTPKVVKEWCEEHGKEIIVAHSKLYGYHKPTRATARQTAIDVFFDNFVSKWLMFIDDDVILPSNWYGIASKYMSSDVGLIWGWDYPVNKHALSKLLPTYYLRDKSLYKIMVRNFKLRGGTHDILLRREAIEGIKIPPDLHVYEDWYIKQYVQSKGYKIIAPPELYCYHALMHTTYDYKTIQAIMMLRKRYNPYGAIPRSALKILCYKLYSLGKAFLILLLSRDAVAFKQYLDVSKYQFICMWYWRW